VREEQASVGQRLLWLMDHYQGGQSTLNEQLLWRLPGQADVPALQAALDQLTARHEMLRTTFVERRRHLVQQIHPPTSLPLAIVELAGTPVRAAITTELAQRIDPGQGPVRATLFRAADEDVLCLSLHHLITDDWSNALVSHQLRQLYAQQLGEESELPPVDWQYADWTRWQREMLAGAGRDKLLAHWRSTLAGAALPHLPRRGSGPPVRRSAEVNLDPATVTALREVARTQRTTLFPAVLAVFHALLYQRTGQDDLTVASLFANRSRPEVQQTVGFFVNMVALRARVDPAASFTELVRRNRGTVLDALRHQDLPYQMLPPGLIASPTGRPDDVVFQLLDPATSRADVHGSELDELEPQIERSRFDLELALVPMGGTFVALLMYTDHVFDPAGAQRFVHDYSALADRAAADPAASLSTLLAPLDPAPASAAS
jgi:Condensation domain